MIKIRGLEKSFGNEKVLKSIDLDIQKGDIFGLVGRSGSGKSTLLRCINGLESYDSGSLKVEEQEVCNLKGMDLRKFRQKAGMIFQHFSLLERDTVYNNIALPLKCWRYPKNDIPKKVNELLKIVGLEDKRNQKPRNLSGGQKQRVAIARALSMDSTILLCDECTSALDPNTTKSVLALLKDINQKFGVTVVIVTHEMSVVRAICNKVAVLNKNGIADEGNVEDVFMNQCPALIDLLGDKDVEEIPKYGRTIKIFYSSNLLGKNIISKMAQETGVIFNMLSGGIDKYRTGMFGTFIINFQLKDEEKITDFMKKYHVAWEVLN